MNPSDIGKAYDQITHLWAGGQFDLNNGIEPHKRAVVLLDKQHRGAALDIGCGCTGRFIDLLLNETTSHRHRMRFWLCKSRLFHRE